MLRFENRRRARATGRKSFSMMQHHFTWKSGSSKRARAASSSGRGAKLVAATRKRSKKRIGTGIAGWLKKSPTVFAGSSQPAYSKSRKQSSPDGRTRALWKPKSEGDRQRMPGSRGSTAEMPATADARASRSRKAGHVARSRATKPSAARWTSMFGSITASLSSRRSNIAKCSTSEKHASEASGNSRASSLAAGALRASRNRAASST